MNSEGFVAHCLELLAAAGPTRARKMFGGYGVYVGESFVAVIDDERLFLKVNASTKPQFDAACCKPWVYEGGDKPVTMGYSSVPDEAMDSPEHMLPWARLALQAAREAAAQRKPAASRKSTLPPKRATKTATAGGKATRSKR